MSTFVITGSASGMGAATKARLEREGHRVIGIGRKNTDVNADLSTPDGRADAIAKTIELLGGRLDGFVAFAGVAPTSSASSGEMIGVNYFGSVELLEGLKPLLAAGDNPSAVLISSNAVTLQGGWPTALADACLDNDEAAAIEVTESLGEHATAIVYPATKAAVAYYVRTKAAQYIADGIRLNAISPGYFDTPLNQGVTDPGMRSAIDQFVASIPAGRAGEADEVAALTAFLLGSEAPYIVGSVIFIDGGIDAAVRSRAWPAPLEAIPAIS